jgi:predicted Zn-ribbon and HTH transcriptional regulator
MENKSKLIQCSNCGYNMKKEYVKVYGSCLRCENIMDEKAFFKYKMNKELKLWRGKLK